MKEGLKFQKKHVLVQGSRERKNTGQKSSGGHEEPALLKSVGDDKPRETFLLIVLPPSLPAAELFLSLSSGIGQPSITRTKPVYCREEKPHLWKFRYHWGWRESKIHQEWHLPTSGQTAQPFLGLSEVCCRESFSSQCILSLYSSLYFSEVQGLFSPDLPTWMPSP